MDAIVENTTTYCQQNNILNPVEILRYFQQKMVIGRALEVRYVDEVNEGGDKLCRGRPAKSNVDCI